jgi:ribosomal protein L25 (general stress protein Ctc)
MENRNLQVAGGVPAGVSGRDLATEPAPVDVPTNAWYVVEGGIKTNPTFTIEIKARQTIKVVGRDVEVEIDRFGLIIRTASAELIIDPRYNSAELRRGGKLIAVSDKVRYGWILCRECKSIYEAREFAELIKNKVKELIEETVNITAFS